MGVLTTSFPKPEGKVIEMVVPFSARCSLLPGTNTRLAARNVDSTRRTYASVVKGQHIGLVGAQIKLNAWLCAWPL